MSDVAANWYPDPQGRAELRYWDGTSWTDHISNQGVQGTDPLGGAGEVPRRGALDQIDAALTLGNQLR